jgi:hypothetical protein
MSIQKFFEIARAVSILQTIRVGFQLTPEPVLIATGCYFYYTYKVLSCSSNILRR